MKPYLLWDWNGTLLDDVAAEVASLNSMLVRRGRNPVTLDFFRENFSFPARRFYELVGMNVPDGEWEALAREYHETYHAQRYALNGDAIAALEFAAAECPGQSVISALHQRYLDLETRRFGVAGYMDRVYGVDNLDGGSKLDRAHELLGELGSSRRGGFVLIGDSVHDHEVAEALGIGCVLFSGGSHSRPRLEGLAPVGDTLSECVELAVSLQG